MATFNVYWHLVLSCCAGLGDTGCDQYGPISATIFNDNI
jgi:hypothetical protein